MEKLLSFLLTVLQTFNRQGEIDRIWQINGADEDSFGTVGVGEYMMFVDKERKGLTFF
ncbi:MULTISPECIES: hypothetical protein [Lysinibacillus]|uniref:hypothetical protein n=1 Tax=Lysinibacillus TaxID=400634 RepID=UPI00116AA8E0|nr:MULTISPECIES: hypothetical protein [Lysinibacillus]GEC84555.1 hypothetical protein LSP03_42980 [Lysinibacillus sphaericus]